jgi:hypothetical protein
METLGVFEDLATSSQAVANLVQAGFAEEDITSLTSVPYPDGVLVKVDRRTRLRWLALAGGIAGAGTGVLLAAGTSWLYPVQTGDKPIIALFPTGIIAYEFTMLFAIIGAVIGMFFDLRLPPWRPRLYDPAIAEGAIGICVTARTEADRDRAGELLKAAGARRIVTEAPR